MTTRAIDGLRSFPEDDEGFKYIIFVIDMFGRFVTLYSSRKHSAKQFAEVALIPYVALFGAPQHFMRDNGGQVIAEVSAELTESMGTL